MTTICTSCGKFIPPSQIVYKCRQCVNHFVCQLCETKPHNRASTAFHTLDKTLVSDVQPTITTAGDASSKSASDPRPNPTQTSSKPSSIFNSDEYLYGLLGYCSHCLRLVIFDKEQSFQCQQCPNNFEICAKCMPLMKAHHPSMHTFSQKPLNYWATLVHDLYHLDITCDGCLREGFNGKRYQCQECPPSYDLCENCFGKKHTHHKLKYIQNPVLYATNHGGLAERALKLASINGGNNTNWRDPLTGWTKSDAELITQQKDQAYQNYNQRKQQIQKKNEEYAEEQDRLARQKLADAERRLRDTISYSLWR